MDAFALASPFAEDADEAPGVPVLTCDRCLRSYVQACPCATVPRLTQAAWYLLRRIARGHQVLPQGRGQQAQRLASWGLVTRLGYEPARYSLTPLGAALAREERP